MNAALSATSVDPGLDQLFWTYLTKDKLCYLKNSKSDRQPNTHIAFGFSGISGSSDCGYPPESEQGSGLYMRDILYVFIVILREAFKSIFWKNLGICPNQVAPPPRSPKVGTPKTKKKIDV